MRMNHVKQRLKAGEPSIGTWLSLPSPEAAEQVSQLGFDWLVIDAEHNPVDIRTLAQMFAAMTASGIAPMVRIPWNSPENFKRVLDAGAWGTVVPMVNTREEAERAVRAARYHPLGRRGLAGTRASDYGLRGSLQDYVREANEQLLVLGLIEDIRAVENLPAIMAVEGLDIISIGPADLSQSMGHPGDVQHPEVQAAIAEIIRQGVAAGKVVGMNCPTAEAVARERARGVRLTSVAIFGLLAQGARAYLAG